jgi:hypothetical protein
MSTSLFKKSINAAVSKFDLVAQSTFQSCDTAKQFVSSYIELTRSEDYSGAKRILDKHTELCEKQKWVAKLSPIKDPVAVADNFSRWVGSVNVLKSLRSAVRQGKRVAVGTFAGAGVLALFAPELLPKVGAVLSRVGMPGYLPVLMVASLIVAIPAAITVKKVLKKHADADFVARANISFTKMLGTIYEAKGEYSPNVQRSFEEYEKEFARDFTAADTILISQALDQGLSETKIVSGMSPDQQKVIKGLSKTLREDYFVAEHVVTNAVLNMLVEKDGNSKAVKAMLNSRILDQGLIDRFGIDPLSTVGGKRKLPSEQDFGPIP